MKKILSTIILCLALTAAPAFSHHPAADIVDAEIYEMIDSMVADTPHAELVFDDDMGGGGGSDMTITTRTVRELENMIDDGLLTYISMLDGDVSVNIDFGNEDGVVLNIGQTETGME